MDYSQVTQSGKPETEHSFFTTGAGADFDKETPFEAENNLDLSNSSADWADPAKARAGHRELGNKSISSSAEITNETTNYAPSPALGEVVDLSMPPGVSEEPMASTQSVTSPQEQASVSPHVIKTNERLDKISVKAVDDALSELNQDGNISDFYKKARGMMEQNLQNSYNRKVAE